MGADGKDGTPDLDYIRERLATPNAERIFFVRLAYEAGLTLEEIFDLSKIDPWFLKNIEDILTREKELGTDLDQLDFLRAKKLGYSDPQLAHITGATQDEVRAKRKEAGVVPTYRLVDTCAAEFEAYTPYYYSTYGIENEARESDKRKVMIPWWRSQPDRAGD